jgi:predicted  nucleic acid-binding Zn-ribbon protein
MNRLAQHFTDYWERKGVKNISINSHINGETMRTAAEGVPPIKDAPKPGVEESPVLGSVEQLDTTVNREIEKKFDLQVRRVIEDAVRRFLGPVFQEMEKLIKPKVEQEVAEQSKDVKQDIKQVVPAISKIEEKVTEAPKEMPKEPPKEAPKEPLKEPVKEPVKAASLETQAYMTTKCKSCGNVYSLYEGQAAKCPKCGSTAFEGTQPHMDPGVAPTIPTGRENVSLRDMPSGEIQKDVPLSEAQIIGKQASETQTEENSIQSNSNTTREEIRVSGQEETDMLKIAYHQGETFDKSYFVATDGKDVKVISAIRVIPAEVQTAIKAAEEKGEEAKEILSPEEAAAEIEKACGGTMEGFVEFSKSLPKLTREADLKREAEWAINEAEIPKVEMPKKGEGPFMSVAKDEVEKTDMPSDRGSKVKQYYGRLPSSTMGPQEQAINQQSSVNDKYKLVVKALEEEKEKVKTLSTDLGKKDEEIGKLKEEKDVGQKKGLITSLMGALKKLGPVDAEDEKTAVDMLTKADPKALNIVLDVLKLLAGDGGPEKLPGAPGLPGVPGMPPMPPKPKASLIGGVNLPQTSVSTEGQSLVDIVSQMMDH